MPLNSLHCPRCTRALTVLRIAGIETDLCEHCGGLWLDRREIDRFDRPEQMFGEALVAHLEQFPTALIDHTVRLRCPRHPSTTMMRRAFSTSIRTEVDECPECGGLWLDADELAQIRARRG